MTGLDSLRLCQDIRHMLRFLISDQWFEFQKIPVCGGVMLLKRVCNRRECGNCDDLFYCIGCLRRV